MPSHQSNPVQIRKQRDELQARADSVGLSEENMRQLMFYTKWAEFCGRDIVLVVRPQGVLRKTGEKNDAKIVEMHDSAAADKFAFATARGESVRLATEDEIQAYRVRNQLQRDLHAKKLSQAAADQAQATLQALLGNAAPQAGQHALPQPVVPPPTVVEAGPVTDAQGDDYDPDEPGAPVLEPVGVTHKPADAQDIAKIAKPKIAAALAAAGFTTVDAVADATPNELMAAEGVGKVMASKLVGLAVEARS